MTSVMQPAAVEYGSLEEDCGSMFGRPSQVDSIYSLNGLEENLHRLTISSSEKNVPIRRAKVPTENEELEEPEIKIRIENGERVQGKASTGGNDGTTKVVDNTKETKTNIVDKSNNIPENINIQENILGRGPEGNPTSASLEGEPSTKFLKPEEFSPPLNNGPEYIVVSDFGSSQGYPDYQSSIQDTTRFYGSLSAREVLEKQNGQLRPNIQPHAFNRPNAQMSNTVTGQNNLINKRKHTFETNEKLNFGRNCMDMPNAMITKTSPLFLGSPSQRIQNSHICKENGNDINDIYLGYGECRNLTRFARNEIPLRQNTSYQTPPYSSYNLVNPNACIPSAQQYTHQSFQTFNGNPTQQQAFGVQPNINYHHLMQAPNYSYSKQFMGNSFNHHNPMPSNQNSAAVLFDEIPVCSQQGSSGYQEILIPDVLSTISNQQSTLEYQQVNMVPSVVNSMSNHQTSSEYQQVNMVPSVVSSMSNHQTSSEYKQVNLVPSVVSTIYNPQSSPEYQQINSVPSVVSTISNQQSSPEYQQGFSNCEKRIVEDHNPEETTLFETIDDFFTDQGNVDEAVEYLKVLFDEGAIDSLICPSDVMPADMPTETYLPTTSTQELCPAPVNIGLGQPSFFPLDGFASDFQIPTSDFVPTLVQQLPRTVQLSPPIDNIQHQILRSQPSPGRDELIVHSNSTTSSFHPTDDSSSSLDKPMSYGNQSCGSVSHFKSSSRSSSYKSCSPASNFDSSPGPRSVASSEIPSTDSPLSVPEIIDVELDPVEERRKTEAADATVAAYTDLLQQDEDGDTSLHSAMIDGDWYIVKALLKRYELDGMVSQVVTIKNKRQQTPLCLAVIANEPEVVCTLINSGSDVNVHISTQQHQKIGVSFNQPIHFAASRGHIWISTLKQLLKSKKVDLNGLNSDGRTPLHCAIEGHGSLVNGVKIDCKETIQQLVRHGADLNQPDVGFDKTPLHYAILKKSVELVACLLKLANEQSEFGRGQTPGEQGGSNVLCRLMNARTGTGYTALHLAASLEIEPEKNHHQLIKLLLSKGADPSNRNSDGQLPRELTRNHQIIELLKGRTPSVSTRSPNSDKRKK